MRWSSLSAATELALVPWGHHEAPRHALAAPLTTPDHNLGWLMLIDSVGDHAFSSEDETTLTVHLRQACRIYENSYLHQRLRQQLAALARAQPGGTVGAAQAAGGHALGARVVEQAADWHVLLHIALAIGCRVAAPQAEVVFVLNLQMPAAAYKVGLHRIFD